MKATRERHPAPGARSPAYGCEYRRDARVDRGVAIATIEAPAPAGEDSAPAAFEPACAQAGPPLSRAAGATAMRHGRGARPHAALADSAQLQGIATWNGDVIGCTPAFDGVHGDAAISVGPGTLNGRSGFTMPDPGARQELPLPARHRGLPWPR